MNKEELQALAARMGQAINESDLNDEIDAKKTAVIIICVDRTNSHIGWIASLTKHEVTMTLSTILSGEAN